MSRHDPVPQAPVEITGTVTATPSGTQQVDVTDEPARDLGKVDVASLDQYTPVAGRLPVDPSGVTSPVSVAATVQVDVTDEPARDLGKVDIASLDQYTPISGRLPVSVENNPICFVLVAGWIQGDTFTATGNGTLVDALLAPPTNFTIQVKGTGAAPTAWSVVLEASLDGTNFTTFLTHATASGDGVLVGAIVFPTRYFRSRVASLTLGAATDINVIVLGTP